MNRETMQAYYDDIKLERDHRVKAAKRFGDTPQSQRRIQSANVQLLNLKNRIREAKK